MNYLLGEKIYTIKGCKVMEGVITGITSSVTASDPKIYSTYCVNFKGEAYCLQPSEMFKTKTELLKYIVNQL